MNIRIEHIALWTQQLEQMKAFYETYFQATANKKYHNVSKGLETYFLTFPGNGPRLELMKRPEVQLSEGNYRKGYAHIALSVGSRDKVDEMCKCLLADGHRRLDGPRVTGDGYYEVTFLDPDGK